MNLNALRQWIKDRPALYQRAVNVFITGRKLDRMARNQGLKMLDMPGIRTIPAVSAFRLRAALELNQRNQLYELADLAALGGRSELILAHALIKGRQYANAADFFKAAEENAPLGKSDQLLLIDALRMSGEVAEARQRVEELAATVEGRAAENVALSHAVLDLMEERYEDAYAKLDGVRHPGAGAAWLKEYVAFALAKPWRNAAMTKPILETRPFPSRKTGIVNIGVIDYKSPDFTNMSSNIGDYIQTLAVMRHMARHIQTDDAPDGTQPSIELPLLKEQLATLRKSWTQDQIRTAAKPCHLVVVDRDSAWSATQRSPGVPVWLPVFGWFAHTPFISVPILPYAPEIRPLFFSFHLNKPDDLNVRHLDYLRKYQPIGCRDQSTRDWLMNQGVEAFVSGCVTTTLEPWFDASAVMTGSREVLNVEAPVGEAPVGAVGLRNMYTQVKQRPFEDNIAEAMALIERFAKAQSITTSRLHCYLPSRALGANVRFVPFKAGDRRFDGLTHLGDKEFTTMRQRLSDLLDEMFALITSGTEEGEVYAAWRRHTAPLVEEARKERENYPRFFVTETSAAAAPEIATGAESGKSTTVPIALAFDANIAEYVPAVIRSIEANRTGEATYLMLVRGLPDHNRREIEAACGKVPSRWFEMDHFLAGEKLTLIPHTTISTMDRLYLPELLPELDKVLYLDIDIIVQGDVAELFATDVSRAGVAGRTSINPFWKNQLNVIESISKRLPAANAFLLRRSASVSTGLLKGCFNAGVLVASLERMRRDNFTEQASRLAVDYQMNDQDILNVYSRGDYAPLAPEWNAFPYQELIDPRNSKIIHWAGGAKPWADSRNVRFKDRWLAYTNG